MKSSNKFIKNNDNLIHNETNIAKFGNFYIGGSNLSLGKADQEIMQEVMINEPDKIDQAYILTWCLNTTV